jgi:hypothetical protein
MHPADFSCAPQQTKRAREYYSRQNKRVVEDVPIYVFKFNARWTYALVVSGPDNVRQRYADQKRSAECDICRLLIRDHVLKHRQADASKTNEVSEWDVVYAIDFAALQSVINSVDPLKPSVFRHPIALDYRVFDFEISSDDREIFDMCLLGNDANKTAASYFFSGKDMQEHYDNCKQCNKTPV